MSLTTMGLLDGINEITLSSSFDNQMIILIILIMQSDLLFVFSELSFLIV